HGPRPPRHLGRHVQVPPRQRGVHGSGEDLRRSGRSPLTSSSFFPQPFSVSPQSAEREHPSSSLSIRRVSLGRRPPLPTGGGRRGLASVVAPTLARPIRRRLGARP